MYVKGKYIAADKKVSGGILRGYRTKNKLTRYEGKTFDVFVTSAGPTIEPGIMYQALRELLHGLPIVQSSISGMKDRPHFLGKIEFIDELKRFYSGFEVMVVVRTKDGSEEEAWFFADDLSLIEKVEGNAAFGSGGAFAIAVIYLNPDSDPKRAFEVASHHDDRTSAEFDIIQFAECT